MLAMTIKIILPQLIYTIIKLFREQLKCKSTDTQNYTLKILCIIFDYDYQLLHFLKTQ